MYKGIYEVSNIHLYNNECNRDTLIYLERVLEGGGSSARQDRQVLQGNNKL